MKNYDTEVLKLLCLEKPTRPETLVIWIMLTYKNIIWQLKIKNIPYEIELDA